MPLVHAGLPGPPRPGSADVDDIHEVVVTEVSVHLTELDRRSIRDQGQLASVWREVRQCDRAVLAALDPDLRSAYEAVVERGGPRPAPRGSWSAWLGLDRELGRFHVAVHRRLLILCDARRRAVRDRR